MTPLTIGPGTAAVVTGAASGIGLGITRSLAARGARVIAVDLDASLIRDAVAELGPTVQPLALDVRDRAGWTALAERVEKEGGLDLLVANAGVGFLSPAVQATPEQWDWVIDINLTGVFNAVHALLPGMLDRGLTAHVVATASIGGLIPARGSVYAAAKAGVIGFMESLRVELLGTRVGLSILAPGLVHTNIAKGPPPPGERAAGPDPTELMATAFRPEEIGERVVAGVEAGEFYLLTHPEHGIYLERRFAAIRRGLPSIEIDAERARAEGSIFDNPYPSSAGGAL